MVLTSAEIDAYTLKLQQGMSMPQPDKSEFIRRMRIWGAADDGQPVYLANLISFKQQIQPWPGHHIQPVARRNP